MSRAGARVRAALAGLAAGALLAGCQGAYDLPLPGGVRGDGYHVTVQFADVLDLVPKSAVKVGDVTVGSVDRITLTGWTADVRVRLLDSVHLPDNATASIEQTSLLGEKYVSLQAPTGTAPVGRLTDGDVVPLARTGRNPEVEEVLGALSLLLNGGGVAQLKTIEVELNKALTGNEGAVRDLLSRLDTLVGSLDSQKAEINRAITNIDRLSTRLAAQRQDIGTALDALPGGLKVLADQRRQLTAMLTSLRDLGDVGSRVIRASKSDTVANLKALRPVLAALDDAGDDLPKSLQLLLTYPFPDKALDGIKGDYTNLWITAQLDVRELLAAGSGPGGLFPGTGLPSLPKIPGLDDLPGLPGLPDLSELPVPKLPGVPTVTCTVLGQKVVLPGTSCPKPITAGDVTVACSYDRLPTLRLPFVGTTCPAGWSKVSGSTSGGSGASGSGGSADGGPLGGLQGLLLGGVG